jgi:hypothetical protein
MPRSARSAGIVGEADARERIPALEHVIHRVQNRPEARPTVAGRTEA